MLKLILFSLFVTVLSACASSQRPRHLISGAGPIYPAEAKAQSLQGDVVVRYDVTVDGLVVNAQVLRSDSGGVFDEAALAAVRSWRFNAPVVDGIAQPAPGRQSTVSFRLDGAERYDNY